MLNNADWLLKLNYVDLLREVGACFSVNNMLRAECYKRMEKGLSFLEFNYMIMQTYDFYYMYQENGCNSSSAATTSGPICWEAGADPPEAGQGCPAMTITLLLNSEGKKMGKTVSGAVGWIRRRPLPSIFISTGAMWMTPMSSSASKCSPTCPWRDREMETWKDDHIYKILFIKFFQFSYTLITNLLGLIIKCHYYIVSSSKLSF